MRIMLNKLIITFIGLILIISCKEENINSIVLTTVKVTEITQTTARCSVNILSDGGTPIIASGVCWSTNQSPTVADNKTNEKVGKGIFTCSLIGLIANTTYYIRSYATNKNSTAYGNQITFSTLATNQISDIDGNVYNTITIGTQVWMKENLKVTHYRTGEEIPLVTDNAIWWNLKTGAYCNYGNDASHVIIYGRLYNHYAVTDNRNICPVGWHVPTDNDWTTLESHLGGSTLAGGKMKGINYWSSPNTGADNSSGFTAFPGGFRDGNGFGVFSAFSYSSYYWSSTINNSSSAWFRSMFYKDSILKSANNSKALGFSVRCIKD